MGGRAANEQRQRQPTISIQGPRWRGWDIPSYHYGSDGTVVTVEVEARAFTRGLGVSLGCGALGIRAEHPDLP